MDYPLLVEAIHYIYLGREWKIGVLGDLDAVIALHSNPFWQVYSRTRHAKEQWLIDLCGNELTMDLQGASAQTERQVFDTHSADAGDPCWGTVGHENAT